MKIWFKYGLVPLMSVLFIYAACGYNLIQYCIPSCEAKGIVAITNEPCQQVEDNDCCGNRTSKAENQCGNFCKDNTYHVYHLEVDESVLLSKKQKLSSNQLMKIIPYTTISIYSVFENSNYRNKSFIPLDSPNALAGRAILNSNCILRI